ncbi:hypothetical protein GQ607_010375 [Colletotrichum asianum]|uniref:Uncharacterized protein n=1 Tax=Colletotrichum asianum TaxID=702518 RepID=A0A8H3W876_9PEZI|nr:hypothetical protein GQ607_010375 [Colletotrichum asianum]
MGEIFFLTTRDNTPARNEKEKKACQASIDTHPARAPQGQDRRRGRDHHRSLYSLRANRRPPSLRTGREQPEFFTLGCRGYHSSTRVGSVAPVGNQE